MNAMTFSEYIALRNEQEYNSLKVQIIKEYGQMAPAPANAGAGQGQSVYGNFGGMNDQTIDAGLDAIKLGLDTWGLEQFTGWIGDLVSGGISAAQAGVKAYRGDMAGAKGHALDAGVSLVSAIPLGDIAKLIKLRHGPKYANMFIKAGKMARTGAKAHQVAQKVNRTTNVANTFGPNVANQAQQFGSEMSSRFTAPTSAIATMHRQ